jgi:hypothetical protein
MHLLIVLKKKDRRNLDFSDYKKYFSIPTINYFTTNFNLGTKRGGVGILVTDLQQLNFK